MGTYYVKNIPLFYYVWGMMRVGSRQVSETIFELIAMWLQIQIVWDGMLCWTAPF
jgi:hypothetical protein